MSVSLLTRFQEYIRDENLWRPGQTWLIAVSGGIDSVVLAHLCVAAGIPGRIAHANFQLRGAESDRDEQFVMALAQRYNREGIVSRFDTEDYAKLRKISIQMAARELRYSWFRLVLGQPDPPPITTRTVNPDGTSSVSIWQSHTIRRENQTYAIASAIATAHHLDDNIETLLMNLVKGTGATGLRAMLPKQDGIVRPLLFATREEIEAYAQTEGLRHVEDSSNASDKYTRNFFRHRVLPLIEERYPEARQNLAANLTRFREVETLYRQAVNRHLEDLLEQQGPGHWRIAVARLERADPLDTLMFELLKPFGFSPAQAGEALALLHSTTGHSVASATHRVIRDRKFLLIVPVREAEAMHVTIEEGVADVSFPGGRLTFTAITPGEAPTVIPQGGAKSPAAAQSPASAKSPTTAKSPAASEPVAYLDAAKFPFPLLLRRWKPGDYFYPLGMPKKKKLARFLIDNKVSVADKEKVWVLESNGRILWVVGRRIDDRVKVTPATQKVLKIEWQ